MAVTVAAEAPTTSGCSTTKVDCVIVSSTNVPTTNADTARTVSSSTVLEMQVILLALCPGMPRTYNVTSELCTLAVSVDTKLACYIYTPWSIYIYIYIDTDFERGH